MDSVDDSMHRSSEKEVIICSPCSDKESVPAISYCIKCEEYLCVGCVKRHKERKASRDHTPIAIKEYQELIKDKPQLQCDPCKEDGVDVAAETTCEVCEEQLCKKCTDDHKKRKATKEHALQSISEKIEKEIELNKITCNLCEEDGNIKKAEHFCGKCDEYLCTKCSSRHGTRKATKDHKLASVNDLQKRQFTPQFTCDECNENDKVSAASAFCNECQDYLCSACTSKHGVRKATRSHQSVQVNNDNKDKIMCSVCNFELSALYCDQCSEHICQTCARKHKINKTTDTHELMSIFMYFEKKKDAPQCTTCKLQGNSKEAISFCDKCSEYLCELCNNQHKVMRMTKDHKLMTIADINQEEKPHCDICNLHGKINNAESHCGKCEEFLCKICIQTHTVRKATKDHILEDVFDFQRKQKSDSKYPCDICKIKNIDASASCYCKKCEENLCDSCSQVHNTRKSTKGHKLETVERRSSTNFGENNQIFCKPCLSKSQEVAAKTHCINCKEDFCERCTDAHTKIPGAAIHAIIKIEKWLSRLSNLIPCSQCPSDKQKSGAVMFCEICNQHLCQLCTETHQSMKVSKKHVLKAINGQETIESPTDMSPGKEHIKNAHVNKTYIESDFPSMSAPLENKVTTSTVTISWKSPTETQLKIQCFEIRYRTAIVQASWVKELAKNDQTSHVIKNLAPDTPYEFQIRAKYDTEGELYGPFSPTSAQITTSHITPGKPSVVVALGDKITIKWNIADVNKTLITHYEIRYRKTGESKWQVTSTDDSNEEGTVDGLQGNTTYEFKVRPIFESGEGPYGPVSDQITTKTPHPGKPVLETKATDSITIKWTKPEGGNVSIKNYDVRLRVAGEDKWNTVPTLDAVEVATISELKGSTKYEFQVRAVYEENEGPYGPPSDHIKTDTTIARKLIKLTHQIHMEGDKEEPVRYKVPIKLDEKSVNSNAKFRRCIFGKKDFSYEEKTIMLVGATGSGKSTLIDGMINYIFDVAWDDEFRYNLIDLTQDEVGKVKDQAMSQTEWITNYTINYTNGCQIYYTLNIVDTPGFGDTRGITRDRMIVDQMRELFSTAGRKGISSIDAVCFVTQAPLARLSASQKYIFESILALFGKDIKDNIFVLITFADGNKPPVLEALGKAEVPYVDKFVFNNSALFASRQAEFASMFWKMGRESFKKFFKHLHGMTTRSLVMTADVLNERNNLETTVQGLRPQISDGLNKIENLRQTRNVLKQHKTAIDANRNFNYEVKETRQRQIPLDTGVFVTNCLVCNRTCHFQCHIANDDQKAGCAAIKKGNCTVCPNKCQWDSHKNTQYRYETYTETVKKTYNELKKKYESATGDALSCVQVLQNLQNDFNALRKKVAKMVEEVRRSLVRLSEIALKPNPLSSCQYIDLLIETEKQEAKEGFQARIAMLTNLRQDAELIETIPERGFDPLGDCDMSDIEDFEVGETQHTKEKKKKGKMQQFKEFLFGPDKETENTDAEPE